MDSKRKNTNKVSVGVIGLGFMGTAISANIVKAGYRVWGYDVLKERTDILTDNGGKAASSCREVARKADVLLLSLPSLSAFQDVVWGVEGVLASGRNGLIVMECSTLALADKEKAWADMQKADMFLLDCPISGGTRAAQKDLVVYGSGHQGSYQKSVPIIEAFARSNYYLGDFGNGSKMKLVANLLVAIHNVSAAEAMVFGMKAGLDPEMIYQVMCDSSGRSRMFEVRAPRMVKNDYNHPSMKVKIFQKDLSIIDEFAKSLKCPTPLFSNSIQVYVSEIGRASCRERG